MTKKDGNGEEGWEYDGEKEEAGSRMVSGLPASLEMRSKLMELACSDWLCAPRGMPAGT